MNKATRAGLIVTEGKSHANVVFFFFLFFNSLFLCLLKLLDEFPQSAVFEALAVSRRRSNRYHVVRVFCSGREEDVFQVNR